MPIFNALKYQEIVDLATGEADKQYTLSGLEQTFLLNLVAHIPWTEKYGTHGVWVDKGSLTASEKDAAAALVDSTIHKLMTGQGDNCQAELDALNGQINNLNSQITQLNADKTALQTELVVLQSEDRQLTVSNAVINTPIILNLLKSNCYNGNTKVTNGAFTRIITNYHTLSNSNATLDGNGFNIATNGYVTLALQSAIAIGTNDFSISGWWNGQFWGSNRQLFYLGDANAYFKLYFNVFGNQITWQSNRASNNVTLGVAGWTFLELTRVGTTVRLYRGGVLQKTNTQTLDSLNSTVLQLGGYGGVDGAGNYNTWRVQIGGTITPITTPPTREA